MQIDLLNRKTTKIIWMVTFLLILSSICMPYAVATSSAVVVIDPSTLTVGEEGVSPPTESFTVNVNVENVEDMYGWQITVYFDSTILNCTEATYPTDHVFDGKNYVPVSAMIGEDSVLFGATLYYEEDVFSGNGTLCELTFIGIKTGVSDLEFDQAETYLIDFDLNKIDMTTEPGSVTVIPEFQTWLITLLLAITSLAAVILSKTARSKNQPNINIVKK